MLKFYIFCPHSKIPWFLCECGGSTPNVFNMMYFSALYIFKFESNPLKILVIWFIKGFHTFKVSMKYDFFL